MSGTTPASAIAKTSSGNARKMSITRLIMVSTQPPKKPAMMPSVEPMTTGQQRGEERDQQRDPGAVDDPAEDVAAVQRLDAEQVVAQLIPP